MGRRKRKAENRGRGGSRVARAQSRPAGRKPSKIRKRLTSLRRKGGATAVLDKPNRTRKRLPSDPRIEIAVREMNRGRSLTAAAGSVKLKPKNLQRTLRERRLAKRKGRRWVIKDDRLRRVPVMTGGRFRVLTVRGYEPARLAGEHHHAVGEFVRTNSVKFITPFKGRTVQATNGRRYVLETDPNALHRIAAMDSPQFHEIYEITSNT